MRLEGRTALITGGGTGIGAAVAIMGRRPAPLEEQKKLIEAQGGRALALVGDVARAADAESAVRRTVETFGGLQILVNNAYTIVMKELAEHSEEEWQRMLAVNLTGLFYMCKYALPHLEERGGAVINISSNDGLKGAAFCTSYNACKGAMVNLTRGLAVEWASRGVRVNCICPGAVDTPGARDATAARPDFGTWEELVATKSRQYPLGRIGQPEDVAPAAVYFASDESAWVTGQIMSVDGGQMAGARYAP